MWWASQVSSSLRGQATGRGCQSVTDLGAKLREREREESGDGKRGVLRTATVEEFGELAPEVLVVVVVALEGVVVVVVLVLEKGFEGLVGVAAGRRGLAAAGDGGVAGGGAAGPDGGDGGTVCR